MHAHDPMIYVSPASERASELSEPASQPAPEHGEHGKGCSSVLRLPLDCVDTNTLATTTIDDDDDGDPLCDVYNTPRTPPDSRDSELDRGGPPLEIFLLLSSVTTG